MIRIKSSRWWANSFLAIFIISIALPLSMFIGVADAATAKGVAPTPGHLANPECLHAGTCDYTCPANYTGTSSSNMLCCPNKYPSYNAKANLCEVATKTKTGTGTGTTPAPNEYPTCYTNGDPMSYILCPIFNSLSSISNWVFQNILTPFLITAPISTSSSDTSFKIWSSFRIYGDIVLVVALLIAIIGQVIGGGVVDAYTFRKVIPRVLVAAILINLSVYIVAIMVDITNVVGKSIGAVMTEPLAQNGAWNFTPNAKESVGVLSAGLLGLLIGGGGIAAIVAIFFSHTGASAKTDFVKVALYAAMFVILPMVLAMIAVFITLVVRKGLILLLVIISPIAFALYCLPNTEKYFKKWWDLLLEALLVYPIIVVIFAIADILAVTILSANGVTRNTLHPNAAQELALTLNSIIAVMVAFFLQFLPLLAIPFSFRMAGGTLSKFHEAVTAGSTKVNEMAQKRGAMAKRDFQVQKMQGQKRMYDRLNKTAPDNAGWMKRRGYGASRFLANRAGGYDIDASMAAMMAETTKETQQLTNNGDDTQFRALTVDKASAEKNGRMRYAMNEDGSQSNRREYQTLGGRWVGEADVDAAQQRWKGNHLYQQSALAYEMKKATTQEENDGLVNNYGDLAKSWGLNDEEAGSAWTGAAYANQGNKLEMKHYKWKDGKLALDGKALSQEIDETRGTYDMSKFTSDTWASLEGETQAARTSLAAPDAGLTRKSGETDALFANRVSSQQKSAAETLQRGSRIARSFVQQRGSPGSTGYMGGEEGEEPIPIATGTAPGRGNVVSIHGAAPAAQEAAERFVQSFHDADVVSLPTYAAGQEGAPHDRLGERQDNDTRNKTGSNF